jgi:hypothetical protein
MGMVMKISERESIERLLSDFAWHADRQEASELSNLFVSDGVLHIGGQQLSGRTAIEEDCLRRLGASPRRTRHVWSNLRIEHSAATLIRSTSVQVTFEQMPNEAPRYRVSDVSDTFLKDGGGSWKFLSRRISKEIA